MKQQRPIRLDPALMAQAEAQAALEHRSVPAQIAYWANLGKYLADILSPEQRLELIQGLVRITLEDSRPEHFDVDDVLASLEADRQSGHLANAVTGSAVRYGIDPDHPDRLVAVNAHGKHLVSHEENAHEPG